MAGMPPPPPNPYKMLSKTFQSSVRYTPGYLDRITLDDVRYQQYQDQVRATVQPTAHPTDVKRMGDKYFYVHRNIPVEQQYDRTSLKRSEVRPWDEIVDRPLMTPRVREKEVQLPYPQEHPHNSHIPHYLTFPDPYPHPPNPLTNPPLTPKAPRRPLSAGIAHRVTPPPLVKAASPDIDGCKFEGEGAEGKEEEKDEKDNGQSEGVRSTNRLVVDNRHPCNPPRKNYIARKAYDTGTRVEVLDLKEPGKTPEVEHLLWQMPKFSRKRCITYPTPSHQFSRQTTTPNYLQLSSPSTTSYLHSATPTIPAHLQQHVHNAVSDFHRTMCRTTSYKDHYPAHPITPSSRGGIDRTLRSVSSFRPFTSEQRGKYHFNTGGGSGLATPTPRPGTTAQITLPLPPPELKKIDPSQRKERTNSDSNTNRYRNGSDNAAIVINDEEEPTAMETNDKATTSESHGDDKKVAKKSNKDGSHVTNDQPISSHLSGDIVRKPRPKSCTGRISSASRVLAQQHKLPLLQDGNFRLPLINDCDNNNASHMYPLDSAHKMAFASLGMAPPINQSVGEMVTPPSLRMKRSHTHHSSLPSPRKLVSQNFTEVQQVPSSAPKQPSQAQIVKHFTRNLQRELYSSPDMRGVTMKEGKRHTFYGHHGYDFH